MEQRTKDRLFLFLFFLIIALAIYLIFFVHTQSYRAISNPLAYGIQNLEGNTSHVQCSCIIYSLNGGQNSLFDLTDKGIVPIPSGPT